MAYAIQRGFCMLDAIFVFTHQRRDAAEQLHGAACGQLQQSVLDKVDRFFGSQPHQKVGKALGKLINADLNFLFSFARRGKLEHDVGLARLGGEGFENNSPLRRQQFDQILILQFSHPIAQFANA